MSTDTPAPQESTGTETDPTAGTVTGPHDGRDTDGEIDHRYWRCERCGLETTDPQLLKGCFRCGGVDRIPKNEEAAGGLPDG